MLWKQRAKKFWLRDEDLNTKFFHVSTTCRAKVNQVLRLRRDDGSMVEDQPSVKSVVVSYFQNLFTSRDGSYAPVVDTLSRCVMDDDNIELIKPFEKEEFRHALMEIDSDKTPGPYDFNPGFYKRFLGRLW